MTDIPAGERWGGAPAKPIREFFREVAAVKKLAAADARTAAIRKRPMTRRKRQDGKGDGMNETAAQVLESYDIQRLLTLLPHRYPFLLVDRIVEARGDEYGVGIKNVTVNEPHFQGHFPESPVMPGVLLIEAMAQTAGRALRRLASRATAQAERRLSDDDRQGEVPQARRARRPGALPHDPHRQDAQHVVVPRRGEGRRRARLRGRSVGDAGARMSVRIHPSAVVEDGARLGADVEIGPFCHVGRQAKLGDGVRLVSHVSRRRRHA